MQPHPYFDLRLHTDDELAEIAGGQIQARVTLHEWPLSCVQQLKLQDGRQMIYKAAWGPTVEAEFYTQAHSRLLVTAKTVYQQDGYVCLLIDWIEAPRLDQTGISLPGFLLAWDNLSVHLRDLPGDLPCFLDLRSPAGWQAVVKQTLEPLKELEMAGKFRLVVSPVIQAIERSCSHPGLLEALEGEMGLVHGDLAGDNIFALEESYRVIDWQRPIYGPQALDLVTLLDSAGFDASKFVPSGILRLQRMLSIHWLAQCAVRWFPGGMQTYDRQIADLAQKMEAGV